MQQFLQMTPVILPILMFITSIIQLLITKSILNQQMIIAMKMLNSRFEWWLGLQHLHLCYLHVSV